MRSLFKYLLPLLFFPALLIYKNPGEVGIWFFGKDKISATALILFLFIGGIVAGILLMRSVAKEPTGQPVSDDVDDDGDEDETGDGGLSREDRDYIS